MGTLLTSSSRQWAENRCQICFPQPWTRKTDLTPVFAIVSGKKGSRRLGAERHKQLDGSIIALPQLVKYDFHWMRPNANLQLLPEAGAQCRL